MEVLDLSAWSKIASSVGRGAVVGGGRYREQKLSIHRHEDGRSMVVGTVLVEGEVVAEMGELFAGDGLRPTLLCVANELRLTPVIVDTCLAAYLALPPANERAACR